MTTGTSTSGKLTGRKVAAIFVAFFSVVAAVNFLMARLALSTFGGVVVENSYVASQQYNDWLSAAAAQKRLGWNLAASRLPDDRVAVRIEGAGETGLTVVGMARHPLGRAPDQPLAFARAADGRFVSAAPLPAGRWLVRFEARQGQQLYRDEQELR